MENLAKKITQFVQKNEERYRKLSKEIWNYAELAFHEEKSAQALIRMLEEEGFVVTVHGKGTYVAPTDHALAVQARQRAVEEDLARALEKARAVGLSTEEIREIIEILLEE